MTHNEFGDVKIDAKNSAFALGSDNKVTNTNQLQSFQDITSDLLAEINKVDMPEDQRKDVEDSVKSIAREIESGKPNKLAVGGLLVAVSNVINVANKSQVLIDTFDKWKDFIAQFMK